jgi:hypothetical protein
MVLNLRAPKRDGEYLGGKNHVVKTALSSLDVLQTRANGKVQKGLFKITDE